MLTTGTIMLAMASFKPKPLRPVRSDEEIQRQLDARVEQLEREAKRRRAQVECRDCRYARGIYCVNPLVKGFGGPVAQFSTEADICGPEKALWRERLSLWQRILDRLSS